MTRWKRTAWAAAVAVSISSSVAEAAKPVARVMEARGSVTIKEPPGQTRPARVYGTVFEGENVILGNDSTVALGFRDDGHVEHLKSPGSVTVTAAGTTPRKGVEVVASARVSQTTIGKWIEEMPSGVGGVSVLRGDKNYPPPLVPGIQSTIVTTTPDLSWPAVPHAIRYSVTVFRRGDRLWRGTTTTTSLPFGGPRPLQKSASYTWQVQTMFSDRDPDTVFSGEFKVASAAAMAEAAELKQVAQSQEPALLALVAQRTCNAECWARPCHCMSVSPNSSPGTAVFQEALADLYQWAGRPDAAAAAEQRAKQLDALQEGVLPQK